MNANNGQIKWQEDFSTKKQTSQVLHLPINEISGSVFRNMQCINCFKKECLIEMYCHSDNQLINHCIPYIDANFTLDGIDVFRISDFLEYIERL